MSAPNSDNVNIPNVVVEESSDTEVPGNPRDVSTSTVENEASMMQHLHIDSPAPVGASSGNFGSTGGTVETPPPISPDGASVASVETKGTDSGCHSPLDDQQMVDAILELAPNAEGTEELLPVSGGGDTGLVASGSSSSTGSTTESKSSDPTQIETDATGVKKAEEPGKTATEVKKENCKLLADVTRDPSPNDDQLPLTTSGKPQAPVLPTTPDVTQDPVQDDVHPIPTLPEEMRDPAPDDSQLHRTQTEDQKTQTPSKCGESVDVDLQSLPGSNEPLEPSPGSSIQSSLQGSSIQSSLTGSSVPSSLQGSTDLLDFSSSRSDDADVSNQSKTAEEKRKLFRTRGQTGKAPLTTSTAGGSVWMGKSVKPKPAYRDSTDRSDTSWDAITLDDDSVPLKLSTEEQGASAIFPPEGQRTIHTDRERRAISLPVEGAPVIPDERRAKTEPSDDSSSNPDPRPVSESLDDSLDDVSLSLSVEERERRAVSLPPVPEVRSPVLPPEQRRAVSEAPYHPNLSASPVDVQLPSPLLPDPSPVSQQQSVSSFSSSTDAGTSDRPVNGVSHSVGASWASSADGHAVEGYLGWMGGQTGHQGDGHSQSNLQSPSGSPDLSSEKEPSSSQTSSLSSLSGPTCSDIGGFVPHVLRKVLMGKLSPGLEQSKASGNVEGSFVTVPKIAEPELAKGSPQDKILSETQLVATEQKKETDPQTSVPQGQSSTSETKPVVVPEQMEASPDAPENVPIETEPSKEQGPVVAPEQKEGRDPQTSVSQGKTPTSEIKPTVVPEPMEASPVAPDNVPIETESTKRQGAQFELQPHFSENVLKGAEKPQTPKRKRVPKKLPEESNEPENPDSPEEDMATKKKREDDSDGENPDDKEQNC